MHLRRLLRSLPTGRLLSLLLVPALLWILGCSEAPPEPKLEHGARIERGDLNVLWIVADALGASALGIYGNELPASPRIDAFARDAIVFERAYAQWPSTLPSTGSFLSGRYPRRVETWARLGDVTLPQILRERGFRTLGLSENPFVSDRFGFERGFDEFHLMQAFPTKLDSLQLVDTKRSIAWAIERITSSREHGRFFLYLHLLPPHAPYRPPPPFRGRFLSLDRRTVSGRTPGLMPYYLGERPLDSAVMHELRLMYLENLAYVDEQIGRLFDEVRALGLFERTLIVFCSDHGEAFGEHDDFMHGTSLYEEQLRVPLIVRLPERFGIGARREGAVVQLTSLVPTLLDVLGISSQEPFDDGSLLPALRGDRPFRGVARAWLARAGQPTQAMVLRGHDKLLEIGERQMLFDLASDPDELVDRSTERPTRVSRLEGLRVPARTKARAQPVDADTLEALRALGYLPPQAQPLRGSSENGRTDDRVQ